MRELASATDELTASTLSGVKHCTCTQAAGGSKPDEPKEEPSAKDVAIAEELAQLAGWSGMPHLTSTTGGSSAKGGRKSKRPRDWDSGAAFHHAASLTCRHMRMLVSAASSMQGAAAERSPLPARAGLECLVPACDYARGWWRPGNS